ncbi:MAG TPA: hypothetical protein VF077_12880 [Nitrospiraceae bacterium]
MMRARLISFVILVLAAGCQTQPPPAHPMLMAMALVKSPVVVSNVPNGVYNLTNAILLAPNTVLQGESRDGVIICWWGYFDGIPGHGVCINPRDNCVVRDLTIECKAFNGLSNSSYSGLAGCIGTWYGPSFTNAHVTNIVCNGLTDCFYVRHTNLCSGLIVNSIFHTTWDAMVAANALHEFTFDSCRFVADGSDYTVPTPPINGVTLIGGRVTLHNCFVKASGGSNNRGLTTVGWQQPGYVPGSWLKANDCGDFADVPIVEGGAFIDTAACSINNLIYLDIAQGPDVSWWTETGCLYSLQMSVDLRLWETLFTVEGVDDRIGYNDFESSVPIKFYRVK